MDPSNAVSADEHQHQQQTLRFIMDKLQNIRGHGRTDRLATSDKHQSENSVLTIHHVLQEVQKVEVTVAALVEDCREGLTDAEVSNKSPINVADANSQGAPQGNGTRRACFNTLPPEVRSMVYEYAFPQRVLMFHPEGPVSRAYLGMNPLPPPVIALTCREAYYFSKKRYQQLNYEAAELERPPQSGPDSQGKQLALPRSRTWFNPDRDVLLIDLEQLNEVRCDSRARMPKPVIYNPWRNLTGGPEILFSQMIRSLWPFTTIAKHVLVRPKPGDDSMFGLDHLHMYGFGEAFPSLQYISFTAFEFLCHREKPPLLNKFLLGSEGPAALRNPYDKIQSNQITRMLKANRPMNMKREVMKWIGYTNELRHHTGYLGQNLLTRVDICQNEEYQFELRYGLAKAQFFAEKYRTNSDGDRNYADFWDSFLLDEDEFDVQMIRPLDIRPTCLVMESVWELQKIALDPQKPFETELYWVPRRCSGGKGKA